MSPIINLIFAISEGQENIVCGPDRGARLCLRVGYVSRTTMQAPRRLAYVVHANRANMPRAVGGFLQAPTPLSVLVFTEGLVTWILFGHYLDHHSSHLYVSSHLYEFVYARVKVVPTAQLSQVSLRSWNWAVSELWSWARRRV